MQIDIGTLLIIGDGAALIFTTLAVRRALAIFYRESLPVSRIFSHFIYLSWICSLLTSFVATLYVNDSKSVSVMYQLMPPALAFLSLVLFLFDWVAGKFKTGDCRTLPARVVFAACAPLIIWYAFGVK